MLYKLEELLDEKNAELHQKISRETALSLVQSDDAYWHSTLTEAGATIRTAESEWPSACFAHELLHVEYRLRGLVCPLFIDQEGVTPQLVGHVFNTLDHVKIYPEFLRLGYRPEQFLADIDPADVADLMNHEIPALEAVAARGGHPDRLRFALAYLLLSSPPQNEQTSSYSARLDKIAPADVSKNIPHLLAWWAGTPTTDARYALGHFFKIAGKPRIAFAYSESLADKIVAGNLR